MLDMLIRGPVIQIGVDAVAVMHHESIQAREPAELHQRRAGEVENAREQRHAHQLRQHEHGAADEPVSGGDGMQADEFCGYQDQAGQQERDQRPARVQRGDALFDGPNQKHRAQSGHECRRPVPDRFLDQKNDRGQPCERCEQQSTDLFQNVSPWIVAAF